MSARSQALGLVALPRAVWPEAAPFLALAFGASWALVLAGTSVPLVALALWVPGLAAIVLTRTGGERAMRALGLDRAGWADAYLVAIWLPVVFAAGLVVLTVSLGLGRLDLDGDGLAAQVAGAITLAPLVNAAVMLGPELGWRAYLLPRLLHLGTWRAIALASALWSLWQMPLAVGGARAAVGLDELVQLVWCLLVGTILGWLYVTTRSPWAPALFAGAIGATSSLPALVLRDVEPAFAGPISPIALVLPALAVLAIRALPMPARER